MTVISPNPGFCECESANCVHDRGCQNSDNLRRYDVATLQKQTLCPFCAGVAYAYCKLEGLPPVKVIA